MNTTLEDFREKIKNKDIKIAVVGLGYVGLPLAIEFAKSGIEVLGMEIDKDRLEHIRKKESYITDVSDEELRQVLNSGRLKATRDFTNLKLADVIIICVPTPLKRKYHPDITYIKQAVRAISRNIKRGSLVILESTTYPGTTREVILPLLEKNNFRHNKDFYLAFSPERIDPGNKHYPVHKIAKIVGGITPEATKLAEGVYGIIVEKVIAVKDAKTAEAAKLLENTFRLINIALIDELAMMLNKMDIDIWEVIDAAKTKPFGFMPFYPGPGVGGHCIPKDPLYLYWKAKHSGFRSRFIKLASDVINFMPEYVVNRVEAALKEKGCQLKEAKILILGVTYKKDIKDLRKSPGIDIIDLLKKKGAQVHYHDSLIPYLKLNHTINLKSVELNEESLAEPDCVVVCTDHSGLDYNFILKNSRMIFDTRNVYKHINNRKVIKL